MNDARSYASLSSGLLARKGTAKPAMRPQGYAGFEDLGWNDMGYDPVADQAQPPEIPEHVPSSIAALTPAPRSGESRHEPVFENEESEHEAEAATANEEIHEAAASVEKAASGEEDYSVVAQQRAILQRFDGEEEAEEASAEGPEPAIVPAKKARAARAEVVALPKRTASAAAAATGGRKAAFTLRLDTGRHLRLRLACAVTGRSAQQIVTGALDAALAGIPEIEALAARVPAKAGSAAKRN